MRRTPRILPSRFALYVLATVVALCIGPLGCGMGEKSQAVAVTAPPVLVVPVELRDVSDRIDATGQLLAKASATIGAQVSGQVTSVLVEEGDGVSQGQVLLEIDPERRKLEVASSEAGLAQAIAQVAESKRDLERVDSLSTRDAASVSRLDEARTQLSLARSRQSAAEAELGIARRALEDSTIRAPFSGVIARRRVSAGEYLSTGKPIFDVVALDPIEVEFNLSEIDSARVRIGAVTGVRVAPFPDERFEATVTVISPTIDPRTRTLRVKAEIPNPDGRLRPGLFAHAELGVDHRKSVTMVPEEALVQRADGTVLFRLVSNERVERLVVETGIRQEGLVEIKGLLEPGERVVLRGQRDLVDGGRVSLRTRDGRPLDDGARVAAPGPPPAGGTGR